MNTILGWTVRALTAACLMVVICGKSQAQTGTVEDILKLKPQWRKLADEERRFQFSARFQGRAADSFRVDKVDIDFKLPGSIRLPERMRDKQRMDITGKFTNNSGKLVFQVNALSILDTDLERLEKETTQVPAGQPDRLLEIAERFVSIAEYYADEDLLGEIAAVRTRGVQQKRKLVERDAEQLGDVLRLAQRLQIADRLQQSIQYQILLLKWQQKSVSSDQLLKELKSFAGWDQRSLQVPERLRSAFPAEAVDVYENGTDEERRALHRQFFVSVRLQQIEQMLEANGSNGLRLAEMIRNELPEQHVEARAMEQREVEYRLGRVSELSRQELLQLTELLTGLGRQNVIEGVVDEWLAAQEKRFGTSELAGMLRTADENLFVADQWKRAKIQERGIELLKQAWAISQVESPADAAQIAERLKRLGWDNLNGKWLTTRQVEMLPRDDIQLAIREGRVVRGMTVQQVRSTLGQPARISRLGSSRSMRELWIYDGTGNAGLVVRFRRSLVSRTEESTVEDVSSISPRTP